MSLAAINVTGPLARTLLARAGPRRPAAVPRPRPRRRRRRARATSCGCRSRARRPSSSTTRSTARSSCGARSWTLGADLGIRPHGLQALFGLRLEKGHVIVGMDTELDTTPRRLGMDWAVRMEKPRFIGRAALERTAKLPDHRRWVGFTMDGAAPTEGAPIWSGGEIVGNVTGSWTSPLLGKALMLGWLAPDAVPGARRDRRPRGGRHADALLRPGGPSCPCLSRCAGIRVVADPAAPRRRRAGRATTSTVLRFAPDDAFAHRRRRRRRRRRARDRRVRGRVRRRAGSRSTSIAVATSSGRSRPSARRSPRASSPACPPSCGSPDGGGRAARRPRRLRRRAREARLR